jgi:hypothetical protein
MGGPRGRARRPRAYIGLRRVLIFHLFKGVFFLYFSSLSRAQLE